MYIFVKHGRVTIANPLLLLWTETYLIFYAAKTFEDIWHVKTFDSVYIY